MLQTINCIRMGEVLLDENLHLFILCNNCHTDLRNSQDFRQHLEKCDGLENLFQEGQIFKFNTDKSNQLFGKTLKGIKEFLIYDYNDVEVTYTKNEDSFIGMLNIEEELLNPKWYSDLGTETCSNTTVTKTSKQYDELVEAVTPFVQFKENLKSNNNNSSHSGKSCLIKSSPELKISSKASKNLKCVQFELNAAKTKPVAKRKLPLPTTEPKSITAPTARAQNTSKTYANKKSKTERIVANDFVRPAEIKQTHASKSTATKTKNSAFPIPSLPTTTSSLPANVVLEPANIIKTEPTKEKQTAQILNKLQNLGLQVKRTQPLPTPVAISNSLSTSNTADKKTLEILQKLQSKGMKVKILNKHTQPTEANNIIGKPLPTGIVMNRLQKTITSAIRNPAATIAINQNLNKNLIIRKVN